MIAQPQLAWQMVLDLDGRPLAFLAGPVGSPVGADVAAAATSTFASGTTAATSAPATGRDAPATAGGGSSAIPWVLLAAALTGLVAVGLARAQSRLESRERARLLFAEAYQWYAAYKEFPYAVRRRRTTPPATAPADERIRLSEALRAVQEKLDYFRVWTALEDEHAGATYSDLLQELRKVAGTSMREGWLGPGARTDADMNIGPDRVDLSALAPFEQAYQEAVRTALRRRWWQLP